MPYGIFRTYCAHSNSQSNIEFVSTLIGKEFNFNNKINDVSHFVSTKNLTAFPFTRIPQLPTKDGLAKWINSNPITAQEQSFIKRFVNYDRNQTGEISLEGKRLLKTLENEKANGRKIGCIFGKVIWDFDHPNDSGPIHKSLKHWVNDTIQKAGDSEGLFLVKPHPHEEKIEIAGVANERFVDLIDVNIPSNVIIMGPNWCNTKDLYKYLDLGVVWVGTVQLDLGINGIPVLPGCDWGERDYPIGFKCAETEGEYRDYLCFRKEVQIPVGFQASCMDVLRYTASDELFIPYQYFIRSTTNAMKIPEWINADLDRYISTGDPYVTLQSKRFFDDRPASL